MSTIEEIKVAIAGLPESQFVELRRWLSEKDWDKWDAHLAEDSDSGKLDFLIDEARAEADQGSLKDL
ncbi:hypothetical protein [Cerasicoccus frondis]|uniref:hypothetical protein n=1 Tax=Cerasicoccus frondis TaxID=490090 RepID=UPI002852B9D5|nr:hypothetical protein [Cerasicoccus frondis]